MKFEIKGNLDPFKLYHYQLNKNYFLKSEWVNLLLIFDNFNDVSRIEILTLGLNKWILFYLSHKSFIFSTILPMSFGIF